MSDINWNETAVYEFMRFEREPERRVFPDRDITKLAKAGLIQENETGDWTLTQTGEDELANIRQHFNSGKLSELPLKVRNYYFDWRVYDEKKLPVKELSKVSLLDILPRMNAGDSRISRFGFLFATTKQEGRGR